MFPPAVLTQLDIAIAILEGGPGSGNFGHMGVAGQHGGSTPGSGTLYHGTKAELTSRISSEGFKVGRSWHGRPPSVYFTDSSDLALGYATQTAMNRQLTRGNTYQAVVFEIEIPPDVEGVPDTNNPWILSKTYDGTSSTRYEQDIPPEWIKGYTVYEVKADDGYFNTSSDERVDLWKPVESVKLGEVRKAIRGFIPIVIIPTIASEGGPGSGNFGHSGVPGQTGGSAPETSLTNDRPSSNPKFRRTDITVDGEKHGYVSYSVKGSSLHINEILVDADQRGKGVGYAAVKALMDKTNTTSLGPTTLTPAGRALFKSLEDNGVDVVWKTTESEALSTFDEALSWIIKGLEEGGPGSGNIGHDGVVGLQGGSAPGSTHFANSDDAQRYFTHDHRPPSATNTEHKALSTYKSSSRDINSTLRSGEPFGYQETDSKTISASIPALDSYLAKCELPETITVYRGASVEHLGDAAVGQTFTDPGFTSTTCVEKMALGWSFHYEDSAIIEIRLPEGAHAGYIEHISNRGEAEVLVARGSTYRIISSETLPIPGMHDPNDTYQHIKVELVP